MDSNDAWSLGDGVEHLRNSGSPIKDSLLFEGVLDFQAFLAPHWNKKYVPVSAPTYPLSASSTTTRASQACITFSESQVQG